MATTLRIKRRASGSPGAPASLANAELAFNEVDNILYYGKGTGGAGGTATTVETIAGAGAFVSLTANQTISGIKTITGTLALGSATLSGNATFSNNLTITGDLTVNGTTTSVGTIGTGTWNGTTIATGYGGTGQTSYTDGQLLIGNTAGSLTKTTLTAGTNVSISNGNGSITISSTDTNTTYTAGDGLDLSVGNEFSLDIRTGRGLLITSTELDLDDDLATLAGMQTGAATALALLTSTEVAVIDGDTTATATTLALADRMVINDNGTMVQVALSDLVTFFEDGTASGFDLDGGTF